MHEHTPRSAGRFALQLQLLFSGVRNKKITLTVDIFQWRLLENNYRHRFHPKELK